MFYIVGKWDSYVFVLDSNDESVEMVDYDILKQSGVDYRGKYQSDLDYMKFCVLYGFRKVDNFNFSKAIVSYTLPVSENSGVWVLKVRVNLVLRILCKITKDGSKDFFAFMQISVTGAYLPLYLNKFLRSASALLKHCYGIELPLSMIPYILRLRDSHDFNRFDSAFDYLFTKRLCFVDDDSVRFQMTDSFNVTSLDWID